MKLYFREIEKGNSKRGYGNIARGEVAGSLMIRCGKKTRELNLTMINPFVNS